MRDTRSLNKLPYIMENPSQQLHSTLLSQQSSFPLRLIQPRCHKELYRKSFPPFSMKLLITLRSVTGEHTCQAQNPKHVLYFTFIQLFFLHLLYKYFLLMKFALLSYTMSVLSSLFFTNLIFTVLWFLSLL